MSIHFDHVFHSLLLTYCYMLTVPVTVHFPAAGSSGSTRLIRCSAQANGTLHELHRSIEAQLATDEQLTSLLYRGLAPV